MGTSGEGYLLGKGKLFGKNFWTWGKLLHRGKRETFLASGKLSRIWNLLDKETFLARGNFLERTSGQGENFCTGGKGKHSWQAVSFLEYENFWTRKPSWQAVNFLERTSG
jgi:hypothetical protein